MKAMSLFFIIISYFLLFECANGIPLARECTGNPRACDDGTVCFNKSTSYSGCYKKCPSGWICNAGDILCNKAVEDLVQEVENLKDDNIVNGFAINQLCIGQTACKTREKLENPSWFDNVLNTFVEPYIQRAGNWSSVIRKCHDQWSVIPVVGKYRCQELMADYHIAQDLQNAVNRHGCGTQHDWDLVGEYIKDCVKKSHIGVPFGETYAISEVIKNRNIVREKCKKVRKPLGLQIEF
ncbi:unnamed protein product [Rotaria sp. Silwood1]|nr:unnamed protein product [Rotaria sp. Silwood1]CAF3630717.1 unnamed protein product [Rotaria sp. Silwood1]CAF4691675.1 unnamed protein product [Rotaria sp. Silwood1]CAF4712699.1 unnamed protein product [Rotaria sp. Silwood1]